MPKSMRNAFIRVSATNNTKDNGVVSYTLEDLKNLLIEWHVNKQFKYYLIQHNKERDDLNQHYHIVLRFKSPTPFADIKKKFPYGDIESPQSVKNCVQYLIHMNDLSKEQLDPNSIITNDENINALLVMNKNTQQLHIQEYLKLIDNGTIREYNLTDYIPIELFTENRQKIINGLEYYRRKIMTNKDRNINVMLFEGDTGTYKTTYAKQFATNQHKSMCISSSSNDPMQDYKGEDILILDDIRDDTFKFNDLLKILDNHTNSSVSSRYSNKAFIGDTIILTTAQPLSDWYFDNVREDKDQLYRRIPVLMKFTKDTITCFQFNENKHKYEYVYELPNVNNFTPTQTKTFIVDTLTNMGVTLSEDIKDKILNAQIKEGFENKTIGESYDVFEEYDKTNYDNVIGNKALVRDIKRQEFNNKK